MKKNKILALTIIILIAIFLIIFAHWKNDMREISSFSIIFKGNSNQFLDQDMVDKLLKQNKPDEFRLKKNILDLDSIEKVFKDI